MNMTIIFSIIGAYILGSVSPSYIYYRKVRGGDIRKAGDGNPGAANIAELAGSTPAFVIAFFDLCKGIIPVFIASLAGVTGIYLIPVGIAVVVGHDWPVFLKFSGGKGTMTSLGVLMFCFPIELILAFSVWLFIHFILKIRFIGALITFAAIPVFVWLISCRLLGGSLYNVILPAAILVLFLIKMPGNMANFFSKRCEAK